MYYVNFLAYIVLISLWVVVYAIYSFIEELISPLVKDQTCTVPY